MMMHAYFAVVGLAFGISSCRFFTAIGDTAFYLWGAAMTACAIAFIGGLAWAL